MTKEKQREGDHFPVLVKVEGRGAGTVRGTENRTRRMRGGSSRIMFCALKEPVPGRAREMLKDSIQGRKGWRGAGGRDIRLRRTK